MLPTYSRTMIPDDPSTAFLAAAFLSGVAEGSSIFLYHNRRRCLVGDVHHDDDRFDVVELQKHTSVAPISSSQIAAYSIMYGIASMPMGLVGASPGVAFYPRALQASASEETGSPSEPTSQVHSKPRQPEIQPKIETHTISNQLIDSVEATTQVPVVGTGRGIGRMLRHENLRSRNNQQQHQLQLADPSTAVNKTPKAATLARSAAAIGNKKSISRFISTLDGTPLPTPLAEAMRRSRTLLVGAGLVSFAVSWYLTSHNGNRKNEQMNDNFNGICGNVNGDELRRRLQNDSIMIQRANCELVPPSMSPRLGVGFMWSETSNTLIERVKAMQSKFGRDLSLPPFSWIEKLVGGDSYHTSSDDQQPIALRLVLNEKQLPTSSVISMNKDTIVPTYFDECNNKQLARQPSSCLVLPIICPGFVVSATQTLHWSLGLTSKDWEDLPLNASWLLSSPNKQNEEASDDETLHTTPSLIVEANLCPSLHDILRHRFSSRSNPPESKHTIQMFTRILQKLAQERCQTNITTVSILLQWDSKETLRKQLNQTHSDTTKVVNIDAVDVLNWALTSTIDNIDLTVCDLDCETERVASLTATLESPMNLNDSHLPLQSRKTINEKTTPWTVVDVLGTSIRHLIESTYRGVSFVAAAGKKMKKEQSENSNEQRSVSGNGQIPKILHVASPYDSVLLRWLGGSLRGWKVKFLDLADNHTQEGIVLVLGNTDIDTCQLMCSLIDEHSDLFSNPKSKFVILLEDECNVNMLHDLIGSDEDRDSSDKVSIVCVSTSYEYAFAVARHSVGRGEEVSEALRRVFRH